MPLVSLAIKVVGRPPLKPDCLPSPTTCILTLLQRNTIDMIQLIQNISRYTSKKYSEQRQIQ